MGAFAGKMLKHYEVDTRLFCDIFLANCMDILPNGELSFIGYALAYVVIGIVAMLISVFLKKKAQQ